MVSLVVTAPKKYQVQPEGVPTDKSLKSMQSPIHIELSLALKFTIGGKPQLLTNIVMVSVFSQPFPSVPFTVYKIVVTGAKTTPSVTELSHV